MLNRVLHIATEQNNTTYNKEAWKSFDLWLEEKYQAYEEFAFINEGKATHVYRRSNGEYVTFSGHHKQTKDGMSWIVTERTKLVTKEEVIEISKKFRVSVTN